MRGFLFNVTFISFSPFITLGYDGPAFRYLIAWATQQPPCRLPTRRRASWACYRSFLCCASLQSWRSIPCPTSTAGLGMHYSSCIILVFSQLNVCNKHVNLSSRSVPKFMKRMKVPDYKDKNVFGVPLIVHVQRSGHPLPLGLQKALRYLRSQCLDQVSHGTQTLSLIPFIFLQMI